jgi:hypothetical protein
MSTKDQIFSPTLHGDALLTALRLEDDMQDRAGSALAVDNGERAEDGWGRVGQQSRRRARALGARASGGLDGARWLHSVCRRREIHSSETSFT